MRDIVAGIIITGGSGGSGVELLRGDGTTCTLPSLPEARTYHTQAGLVACGGWNTGTSCVTFSAGAWTPSHTLAVSRNNHVSWSSYPGGVLLLGGYQYSDAKRSTELLSSTSSTTTTQFGLAYDAQ